MNKIIIPFFEMIGYGCISLFNLNQDQSQMILQIQVDRSCKDSLVLVENMTEIQ